MSNGLHRFHRLQKNILGTFWPVQPVQDQVADKRQARILATKRLDSSIDSKNDPKKVKGLNQDKYNNR